MIVTAQVIGSNAQQRRAVRPTACTTILAQNAGNVSAFPNIPVFPNVPVSYYSSCIFALLRKGTPGGNPPGNGDGVIPGVPGDCLMGSGTLPSIQTNGFFLNSTSKPNSTASAPLNTTTPDLGLTGSSGNQSGITYSQSASALAAPGFRLLMIIQAFGLFGRNLIV